MNFRKLFIFLGLLSLFGGGFYFWNTSPAQAADLPCSFDAKVKSLEIAMNATSTPASDYLAGVRSELQIRKSILQDILDCSIQEASDLKTKLNDINLTDAETLKLQDKFSTEIDQAITYYQVQGGAIPDLGILGSKNMAKKVMDWRKNNFSFLAQKVNNFITWVKNQDLITLAGRRFDQVNNLVTVNKIDDEDVLGIIADAKKNLTDTQTLNQDAKDIFWGLDPAGDSLESIRGSLQSLALTYQNFFDLSKALKKILP